MVRLGLVIACRLAGSPTNRSPLSVNATTLGVRRLPSWLGMTLTSLPSMTATTELVVPRSIPMIFSSAIGFILLSGPSLTEQKPNHDRKGAVGNAASQYLHEKLANLVSKGHAVTISPGGIT